MKTTPAQPVGAVLFDLGQVIIRIDMPRAFAHWAQAAAIDPLALQQRYRHDEHYQAHERGEIDAAGYYASLRSMLGIDISDRDFETGWNAIFAGVVPEVIEAMQALHGRIPLYAFSNTNRTHRRHFTGLYGPQLAPLTHIFDSSELGMRKPEARAFLAVAQAIGQPPERILFFDDLTENVTAAKAVGFQTVQVHSPQDVVEALAPLRTAA